MRHLLALCLLASASPAADWTRDASGRTAILRLPGSMFPHRSRGFTDDRTLAFVPSTLREGATVDVIVHYHGHGAETVSDFRRRLLADQLVASGLQAVILAPQGPLRAADSGGGKHEEAGGLNRFVSQGYGALVQDGVLPRGALPGRVILSGHSGGYRVIAAGLERGGVEVAEVWLHDGLYGQFESFFTWAQKPGKRLISTHTPRGGVRGHNIALARRLRAAGVPVVETMEGLRGARVAIVAAPEGHHDVTHSPRRFEAFARTSIQTPSGAVRRLQER